MSQQSGMTRRQRYLENRQRKQNLTFSITASVMAVLVILSLLVLMGVVKMPFSDKFSEAVHYAATGDVPCPSTGATPVAAEDITVQVLNATSQQGLATSVTKMLTTVGYAALDPGNSDTAYAGGVEIDVGRNAVDAGYTVARLFPDSRVILTDSTDSTVTVILGTFYDGVQSDEDAKKTAASTSPLQGLTGCLALNPDTTQSGAESGTQSGSQSDSQSGN